MRPGLFVKALTPEEQKQLEIQRYRIIDQNTHDTKKILDAVEILKEQIATLEKDTAESSSEDSHTHTD